MNVIMNMDKIINVNERQLTDELIYSKMYVDEEISYNKKRDTFNIRVLDVLSIKFSFREKHRFTS